MQTEVIASLEGMKVIVTPVRCELHEYDFVENAWNQLETSDRPLSRSMAERWLDGWNRQDHFTAVNLLTEPRDV